jgi:hypothetical protein
MSMIRKSHLSIALAGLALFTGSQAFACSTAQWGSGLTGGAGGPQAAVGGVVAGQPNGGGGGTATRYSGLCGLRAVSAGQNVADGTPVAESTYIARFYAHVNMSNGVPVVFRVAEGSSPEIAGSVPLIRIQYNRANERFEAVNRTGTVSPIGAASSAPNNKFYHIHLSWARATGNLDVSVQGGGATTATTASLTGFSSTSGSTGPDFAQLGWVEGAAVGQINVDAFESRRSTNIPRLCRGDANGDTNLNVGDRGTVTTETLGGALGSGQPDCNEDGVVNVGDRGCITTRVLAGNTCAATP